MPKLTKISRNEIPPLLTPKINQLRDMTEGLQAMIENFEHGLRQGLKEEYKRFKGGPNEITKKQLKINIQQDTENLHRSKQQLGQVDTQLQRMQTIQEQAAIETNALHIENTLNKTQCKALIAAIELQHFLANVDEQEKLFLDTILQHVTSIKDTIDIGREYPSASIPMLENEVKYANKLLTIYNNSELMNKIQKIHSIQQEASTNKKLSIDEKKILNILCNNLIKEYMNNPNSDAVKDTADACIKHALVRSKDIKITTGFKGFFNNICETIGLNPAFTISKSTIINQMRAMKQEIADIKRDVPGVVAPSPEAAAMKK